MIYVYSFNLTDGAKSLLSANRFNYACC